MPGFTDEPPTKREGRRTLTDPKAELLVPMVRTVLDPAELMGAFRTILDSTSREQLLCLMAQVWLETANGTSSYGFNLAGIKYTVGCGHSYYEAWTTETVDGYDQPMRLLFRAYPTLAAAADDYLSILRRYYGSAVAAAARGDLQGFNAGLTRWHTSPPDRYLAGLKARYALLDHATAPAGPVDVSVIHPSVVADQPTDPSDLPPTEST